MTVDERWKFVKEHRLCFVCFETYHISKDCNATLKCRKCQELHHVLLHRSEKAHPDGVLPKSRSIENRLRHLRKTIATDSKVGLMILTAIVRNSAGRIEERVRFYGAIDTGATCTLCSRNLAERIYGKWTVDSYQKYQLFDGSLMQCDSMKGNLELEKTSGDTINFEMVTFVDQVLPFAEYLPRFGGLPHRIDIMLGGDFVWKHVFVGNQPQLRGGSEEAAHELGTFWLSTSTQNDVSTSDDIIAVADPTHPPTPAGLKIRFAPEDRKSDFERLIKDPLHSSKNDNKLSTSRKNDQILQWYHSSVKEVQLENCETHLEFRLPWETDPRSGLLQNNYQQTKAALYSLKKKLQANPTLKSKYCEKIERAIKDGHLVRVDDEILEGNAFNESKPCFYIPHFNTSQAKFRVVYDAAREYRGVSLNDMLERGPIFMQSLRSILIRFYEHKYGVASDITNMFFQIQIAPEDRDMLRILWFDGPDMQGDIAAFQFQVVPYGLRCIPSIAGYAMVYIAEKNTPSVSSDATSRVKRDMFVDDFISGVDSVEEGQKVVNKVTKLLKSTGFTLSKWNASYKEILAEISEDDLAPSIRNIQQESNGATSSQHQTTLGLIRDTETDMMSVKKPRLHPVSEGSFTKRQAVSCNGGHHFKQD